MQQEGSAPVRAPGGKDVQELLRVRAKMVILLELVDGLLAESGLVAEQSL